MTKEEMIQDILKGMEGIGGIPSNKEFYAEFDFRLRSALGIESEIERLKVEREWISVNDRLPKNNIDVIVMLEWGEIDTDYLTSNNEFEFFGKKVTHWMPLPKNP